MRLARPAAEPFPRLGSPPDAPESPGLYQGTVMHAAPLLSDGAAPVRTARTR